MKYKIVKNTGNFTYYNIALEKFLTESCDEDELILYLWINEPSVIAGCNQNVIKEWDDKYLREHGVHPVRRFTGGGCVYHDLGNLNYSFISRAKDKDIEKWLEIVLDGVRSFGISAAFTGRNDLTTDGRKFGGTAWLEEDDVVLFHGTLLIDVNTEEMLKCLTPDMIKFEGKAIDSVRTRVVNLSEINPEISSEKLALAVEKSFENAYGKLEEMQVGCSRRLDEILGKLTSDDWIYSRNATCDVSKQYKVKGQIINLEFKLTEGIIEEVRVFTDSLDVGIKDRIEQEFRGKKYLEKRIEAMLDDLL